MRFYLLFAVLPAWLWAQAPPPPTQDHPNAESAATASVMVTGTVRDGQSGAPIAKAQVTLSTQDRALTFGASAVTYAVTGEDGRFRMGPLANGAYVISVQKRGYTSATRSDWSSGQVNFKVSSGQSPAPLTVRLVRQAILSGRVVDEDGEPMQGVEVSLSRQRFVPNQGRAWMPMGGNTTDDRGAFRLFGLMPGTYLLFAKDRSGGGQYQTGSKPEDPILGYSTTYYPGTPDESGATPINVKAGTETEGLDIRMTKRPMYRVTGQYKANRAQDASRVMVALRQRSPASLGLESYASANSRTGKFSIVVPRGSYDLSIQKFEDGASSGFKIPVEVGDAHVDLGLISEPPAVTLSGTLEIQDNTHNVSPSDFRVSVIPPDGSMVLLVGARGAAVVSPDGKWSLNAISPDRYRISISPPPVLAAQPYYVASITADGQNILGKGLDVSAGAASAIRIVLNGNPSSVKGKVDLSKWKEGDSQPVVVVEPADPAERERLSGAMPSRPVSADGQFEMTAIAPGNYLIWAFDNYEYGAIQDPLSFERVKGAATKLRINPGENATVDLTLTPFPKD